MAFVMCTKGLQPSLVSSQKQLLICLTMGFAKTVPKLVLKRRKSLSILERSEDLYVGPELLVRDP